LTSPRARTRRRRGRSAAHRRCERSAPGSDRIRSPRRRPCPRPAWRRFDRRRSRARPPCDRPPAARRRTSEPLRSGPERGGTTARRSSNSVGRDRKIALTLRPAVARSVRTRYDRLARKPSTTRRGVSWAFAVTYFAKYRAPAIGFDTIAGRNEGLRRIVLAAGQLGAG